MRIHHLIAGQYELLEELAKGGMGAVYRARDVRSGQPVAVKALRRDVISDDPEHVQRFQREGEALRRLNHPNIVKILAALEEEGQYYIVMEYVGGGSLADLLVKQPQLPVRRVLGIGLEVADALARAHHVKIVHRDIKPSNILLAEDGTPRLTDFGVALIADSTEITDPGAAVGTYAYLAPEVFHSEPVDARTDIWALGVTLFEMLAGRRPFDGAHMGTVMMAILKRPVLDLEAIRPDAPIALIDLVYRMLEKDRNRRIQTARLAAAELESILSAFEHRIPERKIGGARLPDTTPTSGGEKPQVRDLPAQMTPFVGRESEIEEIRSMLIEPGIRLVTIVGPGGIGKTRLAVEVAGLMVDDFDDGVCFVPLVGVTSPDLIISALAEALGLAFRPADDPKAQLIDHLDDKSLLLVIDNFEQLAGGAGILVDILTGAPEVRLLVTSRQRLNLNGESLFWIRGLEAPDQPESAADYPAVRLFIQCVRRTQPGYEPAPDDMPHILRICRLVQGAPLGIELAAAWAQMLALPEIADEMARSLDFLETEMQNIPARHRSIRAVFEYSWNMLPEAERTLFCKLAVFGGGFTRDAALRVAGASLRALTALLNQSLLERDLAGRYAIHEMLAQYAREKLAERPDDAAHMQAAHCAFYADFVREREMRLIQIVRRELLEELHTEIENLRRAWMWAVEHGDETQLAKLLRGLFVYFDAQSRYYEGEELFRAAVRRFVPDPLAPQTTLQAQLVVMLGTFYRNQARYDDARRLLEAGLSALQPVAEHWEARIALSGLGIIAYARGEYLESWRHYQEIVTALSDQAQNRAELAQPLTRLGDIAAVFGEYTNARRLLNEALAVYTQADSTRGRAMTLALLGDVAYKMGEYADAQRYFHECLEVAEQLGERRTMSVALVNLGRVACVHGQYDEARRYCLRSIAVNEETRNRWGMSFCFAHLGRVYHAMGYYEEAKAQYRSALAICEEINNRWVMAFTLIQTGRTDSRQRNHTAGRSALRRALDLASEIKAVPLMLDALTNLAVELAGEDQPPAMRELAVEIAAFVLKHPVTEYETRVEARTLSTRLIPTLPPEIAAAARARGEASELADLTKRVLSTQF